MLLTFYSIHVDQSNVLFIILSLSLTLNKLVDFKILAIEFGSVSGLFKSSVYDKNLTILIFQPSSYYSNLIR